MIKKSLEYLIIFFLTSCIYTKNAFPYVTAINNGKLTEAKQLITETIADKNITSLNKAIAYKHLGTVLFRLGEDYSQAFASSEKIFENELTVNSSESLKKEYAMMLYQRANCLLSACEAELSKAKLQGIPVVPFQLIKKFISPAERDTNAAQKNYPADKQGDMVLLSMELALAEFHVWTITNQPEMAARTGEKVLKIAKESLTIQNMSDDAHKKLILRYATALVEIEKDKPKNFDNAIKILDGAIQVSSGNIELDTAVVSLWAKLQIMNNAEESVFNKIEEQLIKTANKLEQLRSDNVSSMDFVSRKEYFASRTGLYEALIELYAKQNQPFKLLQAINRMRSRSIQDFINSDVNENKIKTEADLCKILKEGQAMLVVYFIAVDTVWIVTFTESGGVINQTRQNGQEIVALTTQVINVFSSSQHPQGYLRFGPSYRSVPEAYQAANVLYNELLAEAHKIFLESSLQHLYLMPHHILNYLPLATLVIQIDKSNAFLSQFVADKGLPITYLPSLSALIPSNSRYNLQDTLVIARGDYSYAAFYSDSPGNPDNPTAQPMNLPNVLREGQQVKQILRTSPSDFFTENEASEHNLITNIQNKPKAIVHIASHAHLNPNSPLDSYVVLTASHGEDGKVKVRELLGRYKGMMQVGLMVLSACDTNKGEVTIQPGDDIAALSNAFLIAGADNVISTQWPASDISFPQIMEMFYAGLQKETSPDIALATAQQQFLGQGQTVMRYPIFWANIVLSGKNQKKNKTDVIKPPVPR